MPSQIPKDIIYKLTAVVFRQARLETMVATQPFRDGSEVRSVPKRCGWKASCSGRIWGQIGLWKFSWDGSDVRSVPKRCGWKASCSGRIWGQIGLWKFSWDGSEVRLDSGNFPETDPAKIGLRIFLGTSSQDGSCQDWTLEIFPRRILPRLDLGFSWEQVPKTDPAKIGLRKISRDGSCPDWT